MSTSALDHLSLASPAVEGTLDQPLRFTVPLGDSDEFTMVKAKRRHEVNVTLRILERMHALRNEANFVTAVQTLALSFRHLKGYSAPSLLRKYYAYVESGGNWRTLVKGFKGPSQQPPEFVEFIKGLIEQNHRSVATALTKLREELWPAGDVEIPGYGTWMDFFARTYPDQEVPQKFPRIWPEGWSIRNLRHYGPSRAEKKIAQQGIGAAHGSLPVLCRDTSKLRPMEWIVIDDFQLDVMCYFRGERETGTKPQLAYAGGLMAMCVGTRKHLAKLMGPMIDREVPQDDGSVKTVRSYVNALSVQALLYSMFRDHGIPDYDITIICETRTATISFAQELMYQSMYGGRIKVKRTSLIEHKTLTNGFVEGGGTPWEKGWIESDFNYLWNQLADLKGYKGSNERLNAPADLADKMKYVAKFLGQGAKKLNLPAEIIDELDLPFMSVEQLEMALDLVVARAERRTKHRMMGFETITEFRWPHPTLPAPAGIDQHGPNSFRSLAALTKPQQALMLPEERKEMIEERWERLCANHGRARFSQGALALFLRTPNKAVWRNHTVTFTRDKVGYSYLDDENLLGETPEFTDLLAYVDFTAPETAVISRLDGTVVGVLRMLGDSTRGVDVTDTEAMDKARARRAAIVNRVLAKVRARPLHQETNRQLGEAKRRNEEIVVAFQQETADVPVANRIADAAGDLAAQQVEAKQQARRDETARARQAVKDEAIVAALSPADAAALLGTTAPAPFAAPVITTTEDDTTPATELTMADFLKKKK